MISHIVIAALCLGSAVSDYARYVDVFTGTAATGHTTPAAATPFGMVQAGPDSGNRNWAYCSGYQYFDQCVIGYSQTHLSGTGCTDMGDVQILPFTGEYSVRPSHRSVDKRQERGEPGYYTTVQDKDALKVEITATKHVGYYRITSLEGRPIKVLVDPNFGCRAGLNMHKDCDVTSDVSVVGTISGSYTRSSWVKDRPTFYRIAFSRPWKSIAKQLPCSGEKQPVYLAEFGPEELLVRVALSQTSCDKAADNMEAETKGVDFDTARANARAAWNALFARSTVEGTELQKKNWYTSLYHLYFQPNDFSDVGEEPRFTTLSLWDTFRAAQPWYTLIVPEIVCPEIRSMLRLYRKHGLFPRMSYGGGYVDCMIGEHALPMIADSYLKGFRDFDVREALDAMVKTVTVPHKGRVKENWDLYAKYGYLPFDLVKYESCSRTLETSYDDWCLAKFAEAIGEREIAAKFYKRAANWKNIFDPSTGFARGKDSKGNWIEPFDPFQFGHENDVVACFTEGNSFQYSWHVLHDVPGLVAAMGGRETTLKRLDSLFTANATTDGASVDVTGLIGQYVHGNEPSHHIIYFYPQLGHPEKAAERVRDVFNRFYFPGPCGLSGNDDCGQMSAWYVFSAFGFYPFNPCGGEYVIGAPQVPQATLAFANGKTFKMTAKNLSKENKYVKSIRLNGKPITDWKLRHADILAGGELVFEMSSNRMAAVDAAEFGFSPDATPMANAQALQQALEGGNRRVVVSKPGVYRLDRTIYIDDDTTLEFARGVVLSKSQVYANVLANRAAFFGGRNRNIVIRGANIKANGFEATPPSSSRACGLRGLIGFYGIDNLRLYDTTINDFGTSQYAVQIVDFDGLLIDGFELRGNKDGVHLNCGKNFVIRNGRLRTYDDGIALNAGEWPGGCTPRMGSITDGLIENIVDEPGGHCNFARVITGAWQEWRKGIKLQFRDIFTIGNDVYSVYPGTISTNEVVSLTPPTHKSGVWRSPEGINFFHLQSDGCRKAEVRRVTFRNIRMNAARAFSCSWELGEWARLIHPDLPREQYPTIDIRLENVVKTADGPMVRGNADADIVMENCRNENKGRLLVSMGWSKKYFTKCPVRHITVDGEKKTFDNGEALIVGK